MNRIEMVAAGILVFVSMGTIRAQPAASEKKFEVASVKVAARFSGAPRSVAMRGGPGTGDPDRVTFENYSMIGLLMTAFDERFDQISGPDWLRVLGPSADLYDISAVLPSGTSKEDFHLMLRNLLIARFSLTFHTGQRETRAYRLVAGAGPPRLKSSVESASGSDVAPGSSNARATMGADGYPALSSGISGAMIGNRSRRRFVHETMSAFAGVLAQQLGNPVVDATGLSGQYDFELFWAAPSPDDSDGVTMEQAVRDQLGLRLESTKASEDAIVIDHIEKAPSGN